MKYYSEKDVKGLLERIDSGYAKELDKLESIEIPEKHGALVDADALLEKVIEIYDGDDMKYKFVVLRDVIEDEPFIVDGVYE